MIEKVNPSHPDKIADRIAGAIVDLAYTKDSYPKIAVEVLIGHDECNIIIETNVINSEWVFTENKIFGSPSTAAAVVMGRSANGLTEWRPNPSE